MATSSTDAPTNKQHSKGAWIGIDLGTSNCTAAVWDLSRSRCKVLRLGHDNLARPPAGGSRKGGKVVPSAVLFRHDGGGDHAREFAGQGIHGMSSLVGYAAMQSFGEAIVDGNEPGEQQDHSGTLVTSFKRVVGMTSRQARELKTADPEFWNSLPFRSVIVDDKPELVENERGQHPKPQQNDTGGKIDGKLFDVLGDETGNAAHPSVNRSRTSPDEIEEGVAICVKSLHCMQSSSDTSVKQSEHLVTPLEVSAIILESIRVAASEYLANNNKHIQAPGLHDTLQVHNCIIGVPAHFSHAQRTAVQYAAKNAGFTGYVGVMTESTAAAMAYGLFVSPNITAATGDTDNDTNAGGKNILVFDMGGGTTDVTIASLEFGQADDKVRFHVIATAGDRCLGGDNVDELLARHLWERHVTVPAGGATWKASEHQDFISQCRRAKEELCGDDDGTSPVSAKMETHVTIRGKAVEITRQEFELAIQPLIKRAEHVVDNALAALDSCHPSHFVHEVVLVGGSTHIPTVRAMLRRKFPPPIPPELCTSISAETAVAQGLAIQAGLVSGAVPIWELRNAMMLDVLPHSIGVWVGVGNSNRVDGAGKAAPYTKGQIIQPGDTGKHDGHFVSILGKDSPLPAMGSATFTLAAKDQPGVTIIAAEHVGPGDVYQCMGVFDFLLHRLDITDGCDNHRSRDVKIGMTLESNGKFTVSIFDENDPDHREKRQRHLKEKALQSGKGGESLEEKVGIFYEEDEIRPACSGTEIGLVFFCVIFFALYVATRIAFSDAEVEYWNDEL